MGPTNLFFIYQRFLNCQRFTALHGNITMNDDLDTWKKLHVISGHIYRYLKEILGFWPLFIQSSAQDASDTCHV